MTKNHSEFDEPSWISKPLPVFVVVLVALHVLALAYWIYKLATDHKHRTKPH